jgi:DNA adenine methylase
MDYIKSPLNYIGGKYKLLKDILPCFPDNIGTFVDMFAGGFNVGINVDADKIICNDHIDYLIEIYQFLSASQIERLISDINKCIAEFGLDGTNQEGYLSLRKAYNAQKDPLKLFVLTCFSFNHQIRFNNKHEFNTPFGKNRSAYNKSIESNLIDFMKALKQKDIIFLNRDFESMDLSSLTQGDFVYCDPPYLISIGSYNDGKRGYKDWSAAEDKALLEILDSLHERGIHFA